MIERLYNCLNPVPAMLVDNNSDLDLHAANVGASAAEAFKLGRKLLLLNRGGT